MPTIRPGAGEEPWRKDWPGEQCLHLQAGLAHAGAVVVDHGGGNIIIHRVVAVSTGGKMEQGSERPVLGGRPPSRVDIQWK